MKAIVYVLDMNKNPLMPCEPVIARLLLKQGKAKVVRRTPFTIKLNYETETTYTQHILKSEDTGSGVLGASAVTEDNYVLYLSEVTVRNDIKKKLTKRNKLRRNRRSRKTRYRKKRFKNRKNSIKKDRFSPTMTSKFNSHDREFAFMEKLLPCKDSEEILETATFDPHLMKNPELAKNKWGYQKGVNYGFANTRAMVLKRDNYKCQCCKGKHKDKHLEVHHIIYRSKGGSDEPENLITLCKTCHDAVHAGDEEIKKRGKKIGTLSYATQMNSIRVQLLKRHPKAIETFGYITKENRQALGLPKTHCIDAAVAASGGEPLKFKTDICIVKVCTPDGDFQQTKGIRSEQRLETGKIQGFRKFDKVLYKGEEYFIKGRMSTGYAVLMDIEGNKIDFSDDKNDKTPKLSKMRRLSARSEQMISVKQIDIPVRY